MDWFPRRHARGRPPHPDVLTPAEWRVLEQLREGLPNAEIAERLGVSINTVRTHVSSMLAKLELPDRNALAAWRGEPAPASRSALGRLVAGFPLGWLGRGVSGAGPAVAVAAVAVLGALAIAGAASMSNGGGEAPATETATSPATVTGTAMATPSVEPTPPVDPTEKPTPTGTPEPPLLRGDIEGWFTEERPSPPSEVRAVQPAPPSPFEPYDRESREVVLYDTLTMTERNLGEGGMPRFSPDGSMLAWVAGSEPYEVGELRLLDLGTGDERWLGRARAIRWVDDETIVAYEVGNELVLVDVATGEHEPTEPTIVNLNPVQRPIEEAGYRLEELVRFEDFWRRTYQLTNLATGDTREFDAYRAVLAPDGALVLATVSEPSTRIEPAEGPHGWWSHTSNIFEVDPDTGEATFIATAYPSYPNSPFDASEEHVMWTDRACNIDGDAVTRLYDRETGALFDLDERLWAEFTPDGLIARGSFGAERLVDPETLEYVVVLPFVADNFWTPDYRYSAVGFELGHGGVC